MVSENNITHHHQHKEDKLEKYRGGMEKDTTITKYRPLEVVNFIPPIDAIKHGFGEKSMRYIFGDLPLDEYEEKKLNEMNHFLKERRLSLRNTAFNNKYLLLRYLQGNDYDFAKAWDDIKRHVKWRQNFNLINYENQLKQLLNKGYCYVYGRDKYMRPILIFRAKEFLSGDNPDAILHFVYYWFELIIKNMLVWNKIEQWRVIMDLEDVSFYNAPISLLKDIATNLQRNYRGYLSQMTFVNTPLVFWGLWQAISLVLPQSTKDKINLYTNDFKEELIKLIHPSQLEIKYGGTCYNVVNFSEPNICSSKYH